MWRYRTRPQRRARPCPGWDMHDMRWKQAVEWLAAAALDPQECKRQWDHGEGTALLAAGRYWDVLSVPDRLGLLALDLLWSDPLNCRDRRWWTSWHAGWASSCRPTRAASGWASGYGTWGAGPGSRCRRRTVPPGGWSGWSRRTAPAPCTRRSRWSGRCAGRPARSRCSRRSARIRGSGLLVRSGCGAFPDVSEDTSPAPASGPPRPPPRAPPRPPRRTSRRTCRRTWPRTSRIPAGGRARGTARGAPGARSLAVTTAKEAHSPSRCSGTVWPFARHSATSSA